QQLVLPQAVRQWGNLAAFVSGLYTEDYGLLGRSLKDEVAEPVRSILIPYFDELKQIALEHGALGFGISGSGLSALAMCKGDETARAVKQALQEFYQEKEIAFDLHLSEIGQQGIKIKE